MTKCWFHASSEELMLRHKFSSSITLSGSSKFDSFLYFFWSPLAGNEAAATLPHTTNHIKPDIILPFNDFFFKGSFNFSLRTSWGALRRSMGQFLPYFAHVYCVLLPARQCMLLLTQTKLKSLSLCLWRNMLPSATMPIIDVFIE